MCLQTPACYPASLFTFLWEKYINDVSFYIFLMMHWFSRSYEYDYYVRVGLKISDNSIFLSFYLVLCIQN